MKIRLIFLMLTAMLLAAPAVAATPKDVLTTYADIAQAMYEDSVSTGRALQSAVGAFLAKPSEPTHLAAKAAWLAARAPYQQTEVYRFGNAIVDDWEGKVNAWPLDEGLIDYVDASYGGAAEENPLRTANVIASQSVPVDGMALNVSALSKSLLAEKLQEAGAVEANVAIGYHAIEFLLWGQDLNGTGPGNGARAHTDYLQGQGCTNGNCARRAQYLRVATDLLLDDLEWMAAQWAPGGEARSGLEGGDPLVGLSTIVTGMGSLSYGELAGERMQLGLLLHDPEEEHDCFSDNTHNSHYYDAVGIQAVYIGRYKRVDGSTVSGPSLSDLVRAKDAALDSELRAKLSATLNAAALMRLRAETVEAYDQMIGPDNPEGNAVVQAMIDGLTDQTRSIERLVSALSLAPIAFEGSDSLTDPAAVFQ